MANITAQTVEVGEFISIPAWKVEGQVIDVRPASFGSEYAVSVLVERCPEDPKPRWYRLDPWQYSVL